MITIKLLVYNIFVNHYLLRLIRSNELTFYCCGSSVTALFTVDPRFIII